MNSHYRTQAEGGFTLVELLFAIFIFAIVISSVYGSYRITFHIVQNSEAQVRASHGGRAALSRISEDLKSLTTGKGGFLHGEVREQSGRRGDSLSFVSSAHLVLRREEVSSGDALIQYSAEPDEETGLLDIYRSDTVVMPGIEIDEDEVEKHILCSGVFAIRFSYVDQDGNENEEWVSSEGALNEDETSEETSLFPILIYAELEFADSTEGDNRSIFKTAVSIPRRPEK